MRSVRRRLTGGYTDHYTIREVNIGANLGYRKLPTVFIVYERLSSFLLKMDRRSVSDDEVAALIAQQARKQAQLSQLIGPSAFLVSFPIKPTSLN